MFPTGGYFKGIPCPLFEHGLCHRANCHYSHNRTPSIINRLAPSSSQPVPSKLLHPFQHQLITNSSSDNIKPLIANTSSSITKSSPTSITSSFLVDITFGSSSLTDNDTVSSLNIESSLSQPSLSSTVTSYTTTTSVSSPSIAPSHAPSVSITPSYIPLETSPLSEDVKELPTITPTTLEQDIFGSPTSDSDDDDGSLSMVTDGPSSLDMEITFLKATTVMKGGRSDGSVSVDKEERREKVKSTYEGIKNISVAHSDKIVRSTDSLHSSHRPKSLSDMKLMETLKDPGVMYSNKKRQSRVTGGGHTTSKSKLVSPGSSDTGAVKRPRLSPVVNAKVPTKLRQGYLDTFIDELIKKGEEPSLAYKKSLDDEEQLLKRSANQTIYRNLCSHHLRALRKETEEILKERQRRSDERVSSRTSDDVVGRAKSPKRGLTFKPSGSKSSKIGSEVSNETSVTKAKTKDVTEFDLNVVLSPGGIKPQLESVGKPVKRSKDDADPIMSTVKAEMSFNPQVFDDLKDVEFIKLTATTDDSVLLADEPLEGSPFPSSGANTKSFYSSKRKSSDGNNGQAGQSSSIKKRKKGCVTDKSPGLSFESMLLQPDKKIMKKKTKTQLRAGTNPTVTRKKSSDTLYRIDDNTDFSKNRTNIEGKMGSSSDDSSTVLITSDNGKKTGAALTDRKRKRESALSSNERNDSSDSISSMTASDTGIIDLTGSLKSPSPTEPTSSRSPTLSPIVNLESPTEDFSPSIPDSAPAATSRESLFQPVSPSSLINLTALAAVSSAAANASCKRKINIDSGKPVARKFELVPPKPRPLPSYSIIVKKEPEFNIDVFYNQLLEYSLSEEQLISNGYPRPTGDVGVASLKIEGNARSQIEPVGQNGFRHTCCRCQKSFIIYNDGRYQTVEECMYHYGRLYKSKEYGEGIVSQYSCCSGRIDSPGCQVAQMHVTAGEICSSISGCVQSAAPPNVANYDPTIHALDCEMCYTTAGLELTRVTVIDWKLDTVYDAIVKPKHPIVDYNTRFSGLAAKDFIGVTTTLSDVQSKLLEFIYEDTILIGHSLESDLKALKFIHSTIVDTAIVFPHRRGPPFKRALKSLAVELLHKFIQDSVDDGHDSREDSVVCMELMIMKVKADLKQMKK
uniref:C3H1-type domain-containing protein n=2 Tax=Amphimedon queenslandica TaxID=400682 RepID=A0A1X7UNJ8_AMPQE